jgi:cobalt-zinc-cadmium efflux system outer membrane protein
MKSLCSALSLAALCLAASISSRACSAQAAGKPAGPLGGLELLFAARPQPQSASTALTLEDAERVALSQNPEIVVAARRLALAEAHVPAAGALADPVAMYRGWSVPLSQPWNFNQAQNMFSIGQDLPGRGKRTLRTSIAQSDVDVAEAQLADIRLQVQVRVRKAFDDLLLTDEELKIHSQHEALARQAIEAARIKYAVGKVSQQDILKAQIALTALAEHMIRFDRDAGIARAKLNTLMGRSADAPLNVSGEFALPAALPDPQALDALALKSRPDLLAAQAAADRSHKEQSLANKAYSPDFSVAAGYMLMPPGSSFRNNYMIEGTMTLPWLNHRKNDADIAEAKARATEQDAELAELRVEAFGQIQEALAEAQAAQGFARLYQDQLRPQAKATLQSSVVAYENDKTDFLDLLDSQMAVIDIDLAWVQAVEDFNSRLADLELATGAPLDPIQSSAPEVKP